jgi:hypothetical protein
MVRFSIRDVLWLTVVVAMGAAWWIDRSDLKQRAKSAQDAALWIVGEANRGLSPRDRWRLTPLNSARLEELRQGRK